MAEAWTAFSMQGAGLARHGPIVPGATRASALVGRRHRARGNRERAEAELVGLGATGEEGEGAEAGTVAKMAWDAVRLEYAQAGMAAQEVMRRRNEEAEQEHDRTP